MRLALRALIVIALVLDTARATNAVLLMVAAVRAAAAVSLRLSNCAGQSANLPAADWWLTSLLLAFPLPMRADGMREQGCLA